MTRAIRIVLLTATAGLTQSPGKVPVATPCEVFRNWKKYLNKVVTISGRLERSASIIDSYHFIAEDGCDFVHKGTVYPKRIVLNDRANGPVDPTWKPAHEPDIHEPEARRQLAAVRQSSRETTHTEPRYKFEDGVLRYSHEAQVPNRWGYVTGVLRKERRCRNPQKCFAGLGPLWLTTAGKYVREIE